MNLPLALAFTIGWLMVPFLVFEEIEPKMHYSHNKSCESVHWQRSYRLGHSP
jgi:hypothetical protein